MCLGLGHIDHSMAALDDQTNKPLFISGLVQSEKVAIESAMVKFQKSHQHWDKFVQVHKLVECAKTWNNKSSICVFDQTFAVNFLTPPKRQPPEVVIAAVNEIITFAKSQCPLGTVSNKEHSERSAMEVCFAVFRLARVIYLTDEFTNKVHKYDTETQKECPKIPSWYEAKQGSKEEIDAHVKFNDVLTKMFANINASGKTKLTITFTRDFYRFLVHMDRMN